MKLADTPPGTVARLSTFIRFIAKDPKPKTAVFWVETNQLDRLGEIRWEGPWRCYAFYPSYDTLYETKCLGEIKQFLDDLMAERKRPKAGKNLCPRCHHGRGWTHDAFLCYPKRKKNP